MYPATPGFPESFGWIILTQDDPRMRKTKEYGLQGQTSNIAPENVLVLAHIQIPTLAPSPLKSWVDQESCGLPAMCQLALSWVKKWLASKVVRPITLVPKLIIQEQELSQKKLGEGVHVQSQNVYKYTWATNDQPGHDKTCQQAM